ncbi:hypothetical protein Rsub_09653 [Raphidocelis subcapitata]|uniref:Uncharacterized protein n=1 Tax=Raphidocelis subcapitata TaxID=307507 RepID=A0A2V0PHR5_9CHLO|nr:hypothetical protein Rsub_09653 [Raphidocelis subcapitata]|eukprot:GBF96797.1 hypothetical protein Rsub_09653 [Raphidocelis subcapitata]
MARPQRGAARRACAALLLALFAVSAASDHAAGGARSLQQDGAAAAAPPPACSPPPPPVQRPAGAPERVSALVAAAMAAHAPQDGRMLTPKSALKIATALGGVDGLGSVRPSAGSPAEAAAESLAAITGEPAAAAAAAALGAAVPIDAAPAAAAAAASPDASAPQRASALFKQSAGGAPTPTYSIASLLTKPECPIMSRITKMTCTTHPVTSNVVAIAYETSSGTTEQVCSPVCSGCKSVTTNLEPHEFTSMMGIYKSNDGLAVAGIVHILNTKRYLMCGDGVASAGELVVWGPVADDSLLANGNPFKAVSSLLGVCSMSTTAPSLQRMGDVCFSWAHAVALAVALPVAFTVTVTVTVTLPLTIAVAVAVAIAVAVAVALPFPLSLPIAVAVTRALALAVAVAVPIAVAVAVALPFPLSLPVAVAVTRALAVAVAVAPAVAVTVAVAFPLSLPVAVAVPFPLAVPPSDLGGKAVCDDALLKEARKSLEQLVKDVANTTVGFGPTEWVARVEALSCIYTPSLAGDAPSAQWQFNITICSTSQSHDTLITAAKNLYIGLGAKRAVCDKNYDMFSRSTAARYQQMGARAAASAIHAEALAARGSARALLQSSGGYAFCSVVAPNLRPYPVVCVNYPWKTNFTCDATPPGGWGNIVSCTPRAGSTGSAVEPTAYIVRDPGSATNPLKVAVVNFKNSAGAASTEFEAAASMARAASSAEAEAGAPQEDWDVYLDRALVWRRRPKGEGGADGSGANGNGTEGSGAEGAGSEAGTSDAGAAAAEGEPAGAAPWRARAASDDTGPVQPMTPPNYIDVSIAANDLYRGFNGLNLQTEGLSPTDAAIAAGPGLVLNAVAGKAAFYSTDSIGNSTGTPVATATFPNLFANVLSSTAPAEFTDADRAFSAPSAIYDKITGRYYLAAGLNFQKIANNTPPIYPASGDTGILIGASGPAGGDATGEWGVMSVSVNACGDGAYDLVDMLQITHDRYGLFVTVAIHCMTGAPVPSSRRVLIFAIDKEAAAGARELNNVAVWDVTAGVGGLEAEVVSAMPARPQGPGEASRDSAFFIAQNIAGDPTQAVLGVSVFVVTRTSLLTDAVVRDKRKPKMCMANIKKSSDLIYYNDGTDIYDKSKYIPAGQQSAADESFTQAGPTLYSGLWTHMYSAALNASQSGISLWAAGRAMGGYGCDWDGPTDLSSCRPSVWYGQVNLIEGDGLFYPSFISQDVLFHSLLYLMFPAISITSKSVVLQMAYTSDYLGQEGLLADNGDQVVMYAGVMGYTLNYVTGRTQGFLAKRAGAATVEYSARYAVKLPNPFPFGRFSSSDVVTLPGAAKARRVYTAVPYAYTGPDWFQAGPGGNGQIHRERGYKNVGNFIGVTADADA